jgi:hypothetical protein
VITNDSIKAVELPFSDEKYSMIILLPETDYRIDSLIMDLNQEKWKQWESEFYKHAVQMYLPKFRFDYDNDLVDEFDSLGMKMAFGIGADFTNLYAPGGIWIDEINHKTFIDVNEKGAEAAAATDVEFVRGDNPILFKANRPFVFMIKNNEINLIIFLGKVAKPVYQDILKVDYSHLSNVNNHKQDNESYLLHYDHINQTIEISSEAEYYGFENLKVDLIDISGRAIKTWAINEPNRNRIYLRVPGIENNIYLIRLNNGNMAQTSKILIR